jgi:hypothetical protein
MAMALLLSGCQNGVVTLQPSQTQNIPKCAAPDSLTVSQLDDKAWKGCDLDGTNVEFPRTVSVVVPPIGNTTGFTGGNSSSDIPTPRYSLSNLGSVGVVAGQKEPNGSAKYWGPTAAVKLVTDAGGEFG